MILLLNQGVFIDIRELFCVLLLNSSALMIMYRVHISLCRECVGSNLVQLVGMGGDCSFC